MKKDKADKKKEEMSIFTLINMFVVFASMIMVSIAIIPFVF